MAKLSSSPLKQKELDYEAFRYVQRALSLDPNNFAVVTFKKSKVKENFQDFVSSELFL